ncbi:MAG: lambda exonuclease family protein [Casimicrobium sp.]
MIQGSEEWKRARAGKVTASRVADIMATIKSGEAVSVANYRAELVVERLTGQPYHSMFANAAMRWGTESEPLARAAYEAESGLLVQECGLIDHPEIAMSAASPDGLVGDDGLIEIKCPDTKTHIECLLDGKPPVKYLHQMTWQIACTRRAWCDFVTYDPRMPSALQMRIMRWQPEPSIVHMLEARVAGFLKTVDDLESRLRAIGENG